MKSEDRLRWLYNNLKDLNIQNIRHVQTGDGYFMYQVSYATKKRQMGCGVEEEAIEAEPEHYIKWIREEMKYQKLRDSWYYPLWKIYCRISNSKRYWSARW